MQKEMNLVLLNKRHDNYNNNFFFSSSQRMIKQFGKRNGLTSEKQLVNLFKCEDCGSDAGKFGIIFGKGTIEVLKGKT